MPKQITRVKWTASGLPSGLSMNADTGQITGTPKASGTYTVPVTVETNYGTASETIQIEVKSSIKITTTSLKNADIHYEYSQQLSCTSTNAVTWSCEGLPVGLSVDAETGLISGTPTKEYADDKTYTVKITASDGISYGEKELKLFVYGMYPRLASGDDSIVLYFPTIVSSNFIVYSRVGYAWEETYKIIHGTTLSLGVTSARFRLPGIIGAQTFTYGGGKGYELSTSEVGIDQLKLRIETMWEKTKVAVSTNSGFHWYITPTPDDGPLTLTTNWGTLSLNWTRNGKNIGLVKIEE